MRHEDESSPRDTPDQQSDSECIADELLVDALLKGRYRDTPETTAQRIAKARNALEGGPRIVSWRWQAGLSTVAAAVIILGLILTLYSPQTVQADLAPILAAFDKGDKTYHIDIAADPNESPQRRGYRRRRSERSPAFKSPRRALTARRLDDATLYVRGLSYVLTCRTGHGGKVTKGFDGKESWLVYPWGASTRSDDGSLLQKEISDHISSLLFLDLRDMLHEIEENYMLAVPSAGTVEDGQTRMEYYLAERVSRRDRIPHRIELWVDPVTHELHEILCTGVRFHGPRTPRYTLQITLVDTKSLPEDWFTQQAHTRPLSITP